MKFSQIAKMLAKNRTGVDAINTVGDAREISKRKLPKMVWDFIDGGADGELAIAANRRSLNEIKLRPKFLTDVSNRDISAKIFGKKADLPFILSPSGMATIAHPQGELAVAKAADRAGAIFCVSTASGYTLEEIASVSNGRLWFQLYLWGNEEVVNSLIDRAGNSGYEALVVTVDVPVVGKRERDLANGMSLPVRIRPKNALNTLRKPKWLFGLLNGPDITFANLTGFAAGDDASSIGEYTDRELVDQTRTWDDLELIRKRWSGPLLVKGVMTPEDAISAVDAGADGIIVSNHGGRQMSFVPGVASIFESVVHAVGHRAEVFLDGGIRRGEDIIKARAIGATAACGGRPWYWGLAAGGEQGVEKVLSVLAADVDRTLALLGEEKFSNVTEHYLYR
ncbi:MAG TPA: alpha-hydroxy-acid oxidizing protein [Acidimicrobiaceae bacterium]|jgi:isopentenyl diphosphate isomerase/L-lactate dehydrogenase-like FMN-dependent dehydrogenase|nr:alpha-hydroxy-acid oxidizing protein [Acidimicrobiaceae bacterium]